MEDHTPPGDDDDVSTLLKELETSTSLSLSLASSARSEASSVFAAARSILPPNPLNGHVSANDHHHTPSSRQPLSPSKLQAEENARLSLEVQALKEQLAEALDVAQTNHRAREQVEDWLFKALAEIDDLREDLRASRCGGVGIGAETPLNEPEPYVPPPHARRGSDLYDIPDDDADASDRPMNGAVMNGGGASHGRSPPPSTPGPDRNLSTASEGHATLSALGRDLLRRTQKKMRCVTFMAQFSLRFLASPDPNSLLTPAPARRPPTTPRHLRKAGERPQLHVGITSISVLTLQIHLCSPHLHSHFSFSISPVAYRSYNNFHTSPPVHWPSSDTHAFNQHRIGPRVAQNVLRTLRRGSAHMEHMSKSGGGDSLFAGDDDAEGDGGLPPSPDAPKTPGTPAGFDSENIDLESEVSTFVTAMVDLFKAKCDDYDNLVTFVKYLEDNVLVTKK